MTAFRAIGPGGTVGILGGGQLGRMTALEARRLGYRVHLFAPEEEAPAEAVADRRVRASWEDLDAVRRFADGVQVVTFEFENVPVAAALAAAERAPVRPGPEVLRVAQNRLREKSYLGRAGYPVAPFAAIRCEADLPAALRGVGLPAVLKTAESGYDGRGQVTVRTAEEAELAVRAGGGREMILESFVDFEMELSVIASRGAGGELADWGLIRNEHARHVLDLSSAPALVPERITREAVAIARSLAQDLDVIGLLCVELFLARDGRILVNELAPRPHNSGHLTLDASLTSQFEQHLRAICGLPLGATDSIRPAAMANLLGDLWKDGEPNWREVLARPAVALHLYGKSEPRPGRKMGHLTALAPTVEEAAAAARAARAALAGTARRSDPVAA